MEKVRFNPEIKEVVDALVAELPEAKQGQMFGHPGYKAENGKVFACHFEDGIAIKLPAERAAELIRTNAAASEHIIMGRSMGKEWVFLRHADPKAYKQEADLLAESLAYVEKAGK